MRWAVSGGGHTSAPIFCTLTLSAQPRHRIRHITRPPGFGLHVHDAPDNRVCDSRLQLATVWTLTCLDKVVLLTSEAVTDQGSAGTCLPGAPDLNSRMRTTSMTFFSSRFLDVLNTSRPLPSGRDNPSWGACGAQKGKRGLRSRLQGTFARPF